MSLPSSMSGIQLTKYGPPHEVLKYNTDIPLPKIKNDYEVLVRVKAAGMNPVDNKIARGNTKLLSSMFVSFPAVLGADFSGIVAEKGNQVTEFEVGDEVFGSLSRPFGLHGTFAQYTLVDIRNSSIAKKPSHVSFEQAASGGIAVLTAYQAIVKDGGVADADKEKKRNILVIGASGGIGSYGVQIARSLSHENYVVGICSAKNMDLVRKLGADTVIDYRDEEQYKNFIQGPNQNFDIIFDCVGGDTYYKNLSPHLKKGGVYSTAVGPVEHFGSKYVGLTTGASAVSKILYRRFFASHKYLMIHGLPHGDFRTKIAPLFENKVTGMVLSDDNVFPLKEISKAHEQLESHRVIGKIVISVE
ncbi:chaperonin 10-like protein [Sporodiniella umbellata]|nr:chaperonin 10-like protein [Sporodiniella umbellata]